MSTMQNDNRTYEADMPLEEVPVSSHTLDKWYREFNERRASHHRPTVDELREEIEKLPELTSERREKIIQQCAMNSALKRDDTSSFDTIKQMMGMYLGLTIMFALEAQQRWEKEQSLRNLERSQERFAERHAARENSVQSSVDNIAAGRAIPFDVRNTMINQAAARFKTYAVTQMNDGNQVLPGVPNAHVSWFINNVIDRAEGVAGAIIADPRQVGEIVHTQADMLMRSSDMGEMSTEEALDEFSDVMNEVYTHHVLAGTPLSLINESIIESEIASHPEWEDMPESDWMTNPRLQAMLRFEQMQNIDFERQSVMRLTEDGQIVEDYVTDEGALHRAPGFSGQLSLRKPVTEEDLIENSKRLKELVDQAVAEGHIEEVCASYHRVQDRIYQDPEHGFWDNTGVAYEDREMFKIVATSCYATLDERDRIYREDGTWIADLSFIEYVGDTNIQESLSAIMDVAYQSLSEEDYKHSLHSLTSDLMRSIDPLGDGSHTAGIDISEPKDMYCIDSIMFGEFLDGERTFGFAGTEADRVAGKIMQLNARAYADGLPLSLITEQTAESLGYIYEFVGLPDEVYANNGWGRSPRQMLSDFTNSFEPMTLVDHPEVIGTCANDLPLITPIKANIGSRIWWKSERDSNETPLAERAFPRVFNEIDFTDMRHHEVNYRMEEPCVVVEKTPAEKALNALVEGIRDDGSDVDDYQIEV